MGIDIKSLTKALKSTDLVISGPLREWLITMGDTELDIEIAQKIMDLLTTTPRDRHASFSASSAGACLRAQVLGYLGISGEAIDAQLQNVFNDGKWRHLRWQAMLLMAGIIEDVEVPLFWRSKRARGTMDGQGIVPDDHPRSVWRGMEFGLEIKGVSGYQFQKHKSEGPKDSHKDQVSRYFLMSGLDLFIIVYEDKSTQDWIEWVFEPDPDRIEQQRKELECLNESVDTETLPPMRSDCASRRGDLWSGGCPLAGDSGLCIRTKRWPKMNLPDPKG